MHRVLVGALTQGRAHLGSQVSSTTRPRRRSGTDCSTRKCKQQWKRRGPAEQFT